MTADLGLAVMVYCKLSHAKYERLRQMLAMRYCAEEDKYFRLKTANGINYPILPGLWKVTKFKEMLAQDHGYDVTDDGKCVTMNLRKQLAARLVEQGVDWLVRHGLQVVVQILGDGYRHFRRMSVINLAMRVFLVHTHNGNAVDNMMTLAIWEGHEDKAAVEEYTEGMREVMAEVGRDGIELNPLTDDGGNLLQPAVGVKWVAGGDMKWIQTCLAMKSWSFSLWYFLHQKDFHETSANARKRLFPKRKTLADCYHLAHRFFNGERKFTCPGCHKTFMSKSQIAFDYKSLRYTLSSYRIEHWGHDLDIIPVWLIEPLYYYVCVLHFLLRLVGALWKRFIQSRIYSKETAEKVLAQLGALHVYTGEIKVVKKNDTVTYDRMPSFTGEEAARILEHWLELIVITCKSDDEFETVRAIGEKAMEYYNILNKRVTEKGENMWELDEDDKKARLAAKADRLQECGNDFLDLYVEGADPESVTHYVVAMTTIIPEQSRLVELVDVSGQGLENLNQVRKNTLTNRRLVTDPNLPQVSAKPGEKRRRECKVGRMEQLAKSDIARAYVTSKFNVRASYYKRKRAKVGKAGVVLVLIDLTADEPCDEEDALL
jgi:hypothetical protein